jgi:hypothetical protein
MLHHCAPPPERCTEATQAVLSQTLHYQHWREARLTPCHMQLCLLAASVESPAWLASIGMHDAATKSACLLQCATMATDPTLEPSADEPLLQRLAVAGGAEGGNEEAGENVRGACIHVPVLTDRHRCTTRAVLRTLLLQRVPHSACMRRSPVQAVLGPRMHDAQPCAGRVGGAGSQRARRRSCADLQLAAVSALVSAGHRSSRVSAADGHQHRHLLLGRYPRQLRRRIADPRHSACGHGQCGRHHMVGVACGRVRSPRAAACKPHGLRGGPGSVHSRPADIRCAHALSCRVCHACAACPARSPAVCSLQSPPPSCH